jgi:hypothetical protein
MDLRQGRLSRLRAYMDGNAPLPEGAAGCRDAYQRFQRKARTNFGELIVDATAERMTVAGFRVGSSESDDDLARTIWKRWRGAVGSMDVHRDMLGLSAGYVMVQPGRSGALITYERPEQAITDADPLDPNTVRAGLKVYRDTAEGFDRAFLHLPGAVYLFGREFGRVDEMIEIPLSVSGGWEPVGERATGLDFVSIYPFHNRDGQGEFETHTDVLDRINFDVLQRLVITAMQAYRQRAIKGDLPLEDDKGNEIDYGEMFKPGPGSLWQLPEGAELWESQTADLTPILAACKDDIEHLAAVTRTPMAALMPEGANQSAQGADYAREGLIFKAQDRINRAGPVWDAVMGAALAIETGAASPVDDVETQWLPPERRTLAEKADAANKATDLPWRDRMTNIWQFSADQVDRMEVNREAETPPPPQISAPTNGVVPATGDEMNPTGEIHV